MQNIIIKTLATGALLYGLSVPAHAQEAEGGQNDNYISIGAGVVIQEAPFLGAKSRSFPLPLIAIKQGAYYFETAETGLHFEKDMDAVVPSIDLFVAARGTTGQDREKITADVGVRLSLSGDFGTLSGEFLCDITGEFEGSEVIARYSYPISLGKLTVTPAVQGSWLDKKAANYMYGVTAEQRERMIAKNRAVILPVAPIPSSAFNLGSEISASLPLSDRLILIGTMGSTYLGKSIRGSIAIDKKFESQTILALIYNF